MRTVATVKDGITYIRSRNGSKIVEYQPGNGSRYILQIDKIQWPEDARLRLCLPPEGYAVTWINANKSMVLQNLVNFLHPTHVQKELNCSEEDGAIITELLKELCVPTTPPDERKKRLINEAWDTCCRLTDNRQPETYARPLNFELLEKKKYSHPSDLHSDWSRALRHLGWKKGPTQCFDSRTHPHISSDYEKLPKPVKDNMTLYFSIAKTFAVQKSTFDRIDTAAMFGHEALCAYHGIVGRPRKGWSDLTAEEKENVCSDVMGLLTPFELLKPCSHTEALFFSVVRTVLFERKFQSNPTKGVNA